MFRPLKDHLQGEERIHSSSAGQQNESSVVKFFEVNTKVKSMCITIKIYTIALT